jgi:hypothetical protein
LPLLLGLLCLPRLIVHHEVVLGDVLEHITLAHAAFHLLLEQVGVVKLTVLRQNRDMLWKQ